MSLARTVPFARLPRRLPVKAVRHTLGLFGRALRPGRDEPPAARASRQARIYLDRRRCQLNEQLHAGR